jgi:coproporphyrinogen III oxidase-like Fe-S oxidoreductase
MEKPLAPRALATYFLVILKKWNFMKQVIRAENLNKSQEKGRMSAGGQWLFHFSSN